MPKNIKRDESYKRDFCMAAERVPANAVQVTANWDYEKAKWIIHYVVERESECASPKP